MAKDTAVLPAILWTKSPYHKMFQKESKSNTLPGSAKAVTKDWRQSRSRKHPQKQQNRTTSKSRDPLTVAHMPCHGGDEPSINDKIKGVVAEIIALRACDPKLTVGGAAREAQGNRPQSKL
jgi:hypothetical protein